MTLRTLAVTAFCLWCIAGVTVLLCKLERWDTYKLWARRGFDLVDVFCLVLGVVLWPFLSDMESY